MLERLKRGAAPAHGAHLPDCLQLPAALASALRGDHEGWREDNQQLNIDLLREARKDQLRKAA